ncbi:hypothetical protein D3C72_1850470 [compost metagenome]
MTLSVTSFTWAVADDTSRIDSWMRSTNLLNEAASVPNSSTPCTLRRRVRSLSPAAMSCMARPITCRGIIRTRISRPSRAMITTTAMIMATSAEARTSFSMAKAAS